MKNKFKLNSLKNSKYELTEVEKLKTNAGFLDYSYEYTNTQMDDKNVSDRSVYDFCIDFE